MSYEAVAVDQGKRESSFNSGCSRWDATKGLDQKQFGSEIDQMGLWKVSTGTKFKMMPKILV